MIAGRVDVRNLSQRFGGDLRRLDGVGHKHALGVLLEGGRPKLDQLLVLLGKSVKLAFQFLKGSNPWGE